MYLQLSQYLEYAHVYYYFVPFELPYASGQLTKKDIMRAIDYQLLPSCLNNFQIDQIFGDQHSLSLQQVVISLVLYRTFRRYARHNKLYLGLNEFNQLYDDPRINRAIVQLVDSFQFSNKAQNEQASQINNKKKSYSEQDFLVTFLETS